VVIAVFYVDAEGKADEVRIESSPHPPLSNAVGRAAPGCACRSASRPS